MRSLVLLLGIVVCISALALVYVRHQNRLQFVELQALHAERDLLNEKWGQLLLEQGAWAERTLVEKKARQKLNMQRPSVDKTVLISLGRKWAK